MPYRSPFSTRREVPAPVPRQSEPIVRRDFRGLDLTTPLDIMEDYRSPFAKNFRIFAEEQDDRRVTVSSRKGSGFYMTPLSEATVDTQTATTGASTTSIGVDTDWKADKFSPSATGPMTMIEINISNPNGATGPVIVAVHEDDSGVPGAKIADSGILEPDISGSLGYVGARFIEGPTITSGEDYWIVVYMQDDGTGGYVLSTTTAATTALTSNTAGVGWDTTTYGINYKVYGSSTAAVKGLTRYAPESSDNATLAAIGNSVYEVDDVTGATTEIVSSLSANAQDVFFTYADNKAFMVNGYNDLTTWDGTNDATITHTQLPILRLATFHKNRLFGVDADDPNRLVYSEDPGNDDGAGNEWYEAWLSTSFIYIPNPKASEPITAIVSFQDNLVVFTRTSKYILYGSDPGSFTVRQSTGKKGAIHQNGVYADENFIYYVADDGFYRFNGSVDEIISDRVQTEYSNIANLRKVAVTKWKRQIRFYYPASGSSVNNRCLIWHTVLEEWMMDTDAYISLAVPLTDSDDDHQLVEASSVAPTLYYAEVDDNNLGKAIDFEYQCKPDSLDNPALKKRIQKFFPLVEAEGGNYPIYVGMDKDRREEPRMEVLELSAGELLIGGFALDDGVTLGSRAEFAPVRVRVSGYAYYWQVIIKRQGINNPVQFIGYVISIRAKRL